VCREKIFLGKLLTKRMSMLASMDVMGAAGNKDNIGMNCPAAGRLPVFNQGVCDESCDDCVYGKSVGWVWVQLADQGGRTGGQLQEGSSYHYL
jgi:hypothetical protein